MPVLVVGNLKAPRQRGGGRWYSDGRGAGGGREGGRGKERVETVRLPALASETGNTGKNRQRPNKRHNLISRARIRHHSLPKLYT